MMIYRNESFQYLLVLSSAWFVNSLNTSCRQGLLQCVVAEIFFWFLAVEERTFVKRAPTKDGLRHAIAQQLFTPKRFQLVTGTDTVRRYFSSSN